MMNRFSSLFAVAFALVLLTPMVTLAVEEGGCGGTTSMWTFLQGDTGLGIWTTSAAAAHAQANVACSQHWSIFSNQVTPVGTWWTQVDQANSTWKYWCRVCLDGNAPVHPLEVVQTPIGVGGAIRLVEGLFDGKVVSVSLVNVNNAPSCSTDARMTPAYSVVVAEDMVMRSVLVDARNGEVTSSIE